MSIVIAGAFWKSQSTDSSLRFDWLGNANRYAGLHAFPTTVGGLNFPNEPSVYGLSGQLTFYPASGTGVWDKPHRDSSWVRMFRVAARRRVEATDDDR